MAPGTTRDQASDAQNLYDSRASNYDNSWHPRFAQHLVQLASLRPTDAVLDLACGTGLVSYLAAALASTVTAVDISTGMLAVARSKHPPSNLTFDQASITALPNTLPRQSFDVIFCASALVLLPDPTEAMKNWVQYLKPGGRLITDVTHPRNQISLITFERVGRRLGRPLPFYRVPFQKPEDIRKSMENAGLVDVEVRMLSQMPVPGTEALEDYVRDVEDPRIQQVFDVGDADALFDKHISHWAAESLAGEGVREEARKVFREEWSKLADEEGKVKEVDGVFVGIGFKKP